MPFARAAARAMMPRLVSYGWSSSRIVGWLGLHAATYRRATMLRDIRKFTNLVKFSPKVIKAVSDKPLSRSLIIEHDLNRPRNYRVYAQAKYTDLETGKVSYRHLSFYDDTLRSKEGWGEEFERAKQEAEYLPAFSISDVTVLAVEHNRGLPY